MKTYIARQPIFNPNMLVYGYELLYRSSGKNVFDASTDGETATKSLVSNATTTFGLQSLADNKYAFINFTEKLLVSGLPKLLTPQEVVVEILEDVRPRKEILECLCDLKEMGYLLAMDDYTDDPSLDAILEFADIVKVDFLDTEPRTRMELPSRPKFRGKLMLAEKVETEEEFRKAEKNGYGLFQGYYFSKPMVFSKKRVEISGSTYIRAIKELQKSSFSYERMERIVRLDVNLTYKLLYRVNTLNYYRGRRVDSVRQALVRMGVSELQRWLILVLMEDCASAACSEFVKTALVRGVFCEGVANELHLPFPSAKNAFITGMFSMIDPKEEEDLSAVLDSLGLSSEVKGALLGDHNIYHSILGFVLNYEEGHMDEIDDFVEAHHLNAESISDLYMDAVRYADIAFSDAPTETAPQELIP